MGHEVTFDRHRFDPGTGRLWTGQREIGLTPRAAAVLAELVEHAGQIVTRDELLQSVWGDTVVSDAALTACIQELRRALADEPADRASSRRGTDAATGSPRGPAARRASHLARHPGYARRRPRAELGALPRVSSARQSGATADRLRHRRAGHRQDDARRARSSRRGDGDRRAIAQGRCVEHHGAGEAYLPLLEAMTGCAASPTGSAIVRVLRRHAPTWLTQMPSLIGPPS